MHHQLVGLLGCMDRRVELDLIRTEFHAGQRRREDRERVEAHVDGAKQRRLDQLQIALIAGRQLRDDAEHFVQRCAGGRRAATDQLENIRVALLRHDRRAGRERVRQLHERKLLRVEQQQVGGQTAGVLHHERDLEHHLRFGFAARELHRRHRLLHVREAERCTRPLAIERHVRDAVSRGGAERTLVEASPALAQAFRIVTQFGRETAGPQCHRAGHRLLHVGVTGELDGALARAHVVQRGSNRSDAGLELSDCILQVQAQRRQHLVVARTPEMHALAGFADTLDQHVLQRRLPVLVLELHAPLAARVRPADLAQALRDGRKVVGRDQSLQVEHFRVRDRCAHVIGHETIVERMIFAGRVTQHALVEIRSLVPQPAHISRAVPPATAR